MQENQVTFYSEGCRLAATVYHPDNMPAGSTHPTIIVNSGYQGVNSFYPKMFARRLTSLGYVCVGFDYRGFADSEGDAGTVLIEQQVEDIRNAVTFARSRDEVDDDRIGLIGWGMGAANVILAAAKSPSVAAVACLNGFYVGERWLKSVHSYADWHKILEEVAEDRVRRVLEGESTLTDPFAHYPLDPDTKTYVDKELVPVYGFGNEARLQFTESLIDLDAEKSVREIAPRPLFIGHGVDNVLHPYEEALSLYRAAESPKTLYRIEGRHNDFMYSEHAEFGALCEQLDGFFGHAFSESATPHRSVSA